MGNLCRREEANGLPGEKGSPCGGEKFEEFTAFGDKAKGQGGLFVGRAEKWGAEGEER